MDALFEAIVDFVANLLVWDPVVFFEGLPASWTMEGGELVVQNYFTGMLRVLIMAPVFGAASAILFLVCLYPYKWMFDVWTDN